MKVSGLTVQKRLGNSNMIRCSKCTYIDMCMSHMPYSIHALCLYPLKKSSCDVAFCFMVQMLKVCTA